MTFRICISESGFIIISKVEDFAFFDRIKTEDREVEMTNGTIQLRFVDMGAEICTAGVIVVFNRMNKLNPSWQQ
ncbi:MAG: hypothetical protein DWP94_03595 [Flavobacterium sp.]|nr:MAG: hypothetical protein DWP94_03595 [Flavobacterium sp.]